MDLLYVPTLYFYWLLSRFPFHFDEIQWQALEMLWASHRIKKFAAVFKKTDVENPSVLQDKKRDFYGFQTIKKAISLQNFKITIVTHS